MPDAGGEGGLPGILAILFLASGCAALIYEVIWLHLLRLVIGASAVTNGFLLARFMGGMFFGSPGIGSGPGAILGAPEILYT